MFEPKDRVRANPNATRGRPVPLRGRAERLDQTGGELLREVHCGVIKDKRPARSHTNSTWYAVERQKFMRAISRKGSGGALKGLARGAGPEDQSTEVTEVGETVRGDHLVCPLKSGPP